MRLTVKAGLLGRYEIDVVRQGGDVVLSLVGRDSTLQLEASSLRQAIVDENSVDVTTSGGAKRVSFRHKKGTWRMRIVPLKDGKEAVSLLPELQFVDEDVEQLLNYLA